MKAAETEAKTAAAETAGEQQENGAEVELPALDTSVVFRKEDFGRVGHVLAAVVRAPAVAAARVALEPVMLHCRNVRNIVDAPGTQDKQLLLAEEYATVDDVLARHPDTPAARLLAPFSSHPPQPSTEAAAAKDEGGAKVERVERVEVRFGWQSVSLGEMLKRLLPEAALEACHGEVTTAFETVGHVAHVNLRAPLLPYRHVIGEAILAKNPRLRTVVTKTATIDNEFRTYPLAVIAGEPVLETEVRESGCVFRLHVGDVYWNSRLQAEHARLVSTLGTHAVVWDLMAGVGPFALPAARNGCLVWANDLNPRSYEYLVANRERNRVSPARCVCTNDDARAFFRAHTAQAAPDSPLPTHVIMNLPASALLFLDVIGDAVRGGWPGRPVVHCYCFARSTAADPQADIVARAAEALGPGVVMRVRDVRDVRDVAPGKHMYLLSVRVFREGEEGVPTEEAERAAHAQEARDAEALLAQMQGKSSSSSKKAEGKKRPRPKEEDKQEHPSTSE